MEVGYIFLSVVAVIIILCAYGHFAEVKALQYLETGVICLALLACACVGAWLVYEVTGKVYDNIMFSYFRE